MAISERQEGDTHLGSIVMRYPIICTRMCMVQAYKIDFALFRPNDLCQSLSKRITQ